MRVLVIDDEEPVRHMVRLTLVAAGHETGEAEDGEEGIERYRRDGPWNAVLLDQRMPGLDGLETLRRLREGDPGACVIMVTAYASVELAVDAMKLGARDFVRKPMTPETLRAALAAAVAAQAESRPRPGPVSIAPPIESVTMNGYRIRRAGVRGFEHLFAVRRYPEAWETEIVVVVSNEAVERVNRLTRRKLGPESGVWRIQAERTLANWLWSEGTLPPSRLLELEDVSRDDIDVAGAWTED
jgi:DNA-binding response OmpR family regulator